MSTPGCVRASWTYVLAFWLFSVFLSFPSGALAGAVNITIDDQKGDATTGAMPIYQPAAQWSFGPTCTGCWIRPDASKTFDGTWHDTTVQNAQQAATMTLSFNGTAIYVFGVVPNTVTTGVLTTNVSFSLDGKSAGTFYHAPSSTADIQYNMMIFAREGLGNGLHTLVITLGMSSVLLFDYALYTLGEPKPLPPVTTSMNPGSSTSSSTSESGSTSEVVVTLPPSTSTTFSTVVVPPTSLSVPSSQGLVASVPSDNTIRASAANSSTSPPTASSAASEAMFPSGSAQPNTVSAVAANTSNGADTTSSFTSAPTPSPGLHIPMVAIIGAGIGALVLVALAILFCVVRRRKPRHRGLDGHARGQYVPEGFAPCYMPPVSPSKHASVSSIRGVSSTTALLERVPTPLSMSTSISSPSSITVSSYTQRQNASFPSLVSSTDQRSLQAPQELPRVVDQSADRLASPRRMDVDVATVASRAASITTLEEMAMRSRVDVLQNQVEHLVAPPEATWEDLPPAYDSPSSGRILPQPPGSLTSDEKTQF